MSSSGAPVAGADRLHGLDELRGLAVLGILLLNILGFGLHSAGYFNPLIGASETGFARSLDLGLWAAIDITAEGAMRGLFSLLFGAGVVLFTTGESARAPGIHYRRQALLLVFGLLNGFVLLWTGDILVTYALCGFLLYPLRHWRPGPLMLTAALLAAFLALLGAGGLYGLDEGRQAAAQEAAALMADPPVTIAPETAAAADEWRDYVADLAPSAAQAAEELALRGDSAGQVFTWNLAANLDVLLFSLPTYMLWDALLMMLLGMAWMKLGILSGARSRAFYARMLAVSLPLGLAINGAEVWWRIAAGYAPETLFTFFYPSYQAGRVAMAVAWMSGFFLLMAPGRPGMHLEGLRLRLRAVGRMALTNYLAHSLIALLLFTGVGLGLVGALSRSTLYLVVLGIWAWQLWWSPRWLATHRFGPVEWLWRAATYGRRPQWKSRARSGA
jgi:uncharacterized protein